MLRDMIYFFGMLFIIGIFIVVMNIAWSETNDAFQDSTVINAEAKAMFNEQSTRFPQYMDSGFVLIVVGVFIAVLALSYYVRTEPVLFWVFWIVVMVLSAVAGYLSNAWADITSEGVMNASAAQMPMLSYVLSHYLEVVIILGMLMLLVFFAKPGEAPL